MKMHLILTVLMYVHTCNLSIWIIHFKLLLYIHIYYMSSVEYSTALQMRVKASLKYNICTYLQFE